MVGALGRDPGQVQIPFQGEKQKVLKLGMMGSMGGFRAFSRRFKNLLRM